MIVWLVYWGITPTTQFVHGDLGWSNLPSHQHKKFSVYKRHGGVKIFSQAHRGFAGKTAIYGKKDLVCIIYPL